MSENENGDTKSIAYSSTITSSSSSVVQITSTASESTTTVTSSLATSSSSILTTSSSSVPPPLIVSKVQETFGNSNNRAAERIGQSNAFKEFFIDDQEQVKFNYQTYKTVFCNTTNKGYILYRYNSLKRSKQVCSALEN